PTALSRAWRSLPLRSRSNAPIQPQRRKMTRQASSHWPPTAVPDRVIAAPSTRRPAPMRLAFVADPLAAFKIYKDTTYAIMREAAARKHDLYAMQQEDLAWREGAVVGRAQRLHMTSGQDQWYELEDVPLTPLRDFDAVLMRKDPPFDMEYIYSTYLLEA